MLHSDLDSVYTSSDWLRQVLLDDGLCVRCFERGAKDNPRIASQRRNFCEGRMKTEIGSRIVEAQTLPELDGVSTSASATTTTDGTTSRVETSRL